MPALPVEVVPAMLATGASTKVDADVPAKFAHGDAVMASTMNPASHTRLPRYVRGKRGEVVQDHGVFVFNDTNAHGIGQKPQHVYNVRFSAREVWGPQASPKDAVYLDMFEDYLLPASA